MLEEIEKLIEEPLKAFRNTYNQLIHSPVTIINEITTQLNSRPGKQLRPILMMLSNGASGKKDPRISQLATAIELLHNATLIHDDVIDESDLRRGRPTVNKEWGNKVAVLYGDYFLAQVMLLLNEYDNKEVALVFNDTVVKLTEGELIQQEHSLRKDYSESHYMETIYKKTAVMTATCCELGAMGTPYRSLMREIGRCYGLAFQMRDDLLDYHPSEETGKPAANDIKEKKMTLPLICLLRKLTPEKREDYLSFFDQEVLSPCQVDQIANNVRSSGALEDAFNIMSHQVDEALAQCLLLPPSPYRDAFCALCEMLRK